MASSPAPEQPVLLLLADQAEACAFFTREITADFRVRVARTEDEALAVLAEGTVSLLVIDDLATAVPRDLFDVRQRLVAAGHDVPMVLLTERGGEDDAVEALRRGFVDFIAKKADTLRADLLRSRLMSSLEIARLRKENERLRRSIEESQQRLFNVYDSLDDAIMQIDHECRVVSVNRSAAALANCEPPQAIGKVCHEIFDFYPCEKRAKKEQCHIYRTFVEGETIRGERLEPKAKSSFQYMTFITTLKDEDYVVYRETDVTEKRRLEQKIQDALRSLGVDPDRR